MNGLTLVKGNITTDSRKRNIIFKQGSFGFIDNFSSLKLTEAPCSSTVIRLNLYLGETKESVLSCSGMR